MVDILLSTYNGEMYLREQIDSILSQTYKNWILWIRDDGSNDNTVQIINEYCDLYPDKIKYLDDKKGNLGVLHSFEALLLSSISPYFMLCDQDDVWLPNKVELCISQIKEDENKFGASVPILVHTDLAVVDKNLNVISSSMFEVTQIYPEKIKSNIHLAIMECLITGCTMIGNAKSREVSVPFKDERQIHDIQIYREVLSHGGHITTLNDKTILYRQHGNNVVGSGKKKKKLIERIKFQYELYKIYRNYMIDSNIFIYAYWKLNYFFFRILRRL